jgi:hypothetical protein
MIKTISILMIINTIILIIINNKEYIINKNKYIKQIGLLFLIILLYIGIYININYNNNELGYQLIEEFININ